jgi:peptidyl-prolyl cis-trans isomerase C
VCARYREAFVRNQLTAPVAPKKRWSLRLLRDPLLLFLGLAAGVFVFEAVRGRADERTISVPPGLRAELERRLSAELGRAPSAEERAGAFAHWKVDQAAAREAIALGLGRDDPQVTALLRARVAALRSLAVPEPSEQELTAFLESQRSAFEQPALHDFDQVFFDGHEPGAESRAQASLSALERGADPKALGDPFRFGSSLRGESLARVRSVFGPEFASRLAQAEPGRFYLARSSEGLHAVRLLKKSEGRMPALSEVRARVVAAWKLERRAAAEREALRALVAEYRFVDSDD